LHDLNPPWRPSQSQPRATLHCPEPLPMLYSLFQRNHA
jgi:hypothetical protein